MKNRRWQDIVMLVLGAWLIVSPFVLQYPDYTGYAAMNSYILGIGVIVFGALAAAVTAYSSAGFGGQVNAPSGKDERSGQMARTIRIRSAVVIAAIWVAFNTSTSAVSSLLTCAVVKAAICAVVRALT